jgi:hypothetical protein
MAVASSGETSANSGTSNSAKGRLPTVTTFVYYSRRTRRAFLQTALAASNFSVDAQLPDAAEHVTPIATSAAAVNMQLAAATLVASGVTMKGVGRATLPHPFCT